jgi:hypothetical protein
MLFFFSKNFLLYKVWYNIYRGLEPDLKSKAAGHYNVDYELLVQDMNGSTLTINSVSVSHSGNYSCQPSSMRPDSVLVTILAESKSANALQDKASSAGARTQLLLLPHLLLLLLLLPLLHVLVMAGSVQRNPIT